jgi:hypothetical protein
MLRDSALITQWLICAAQVNHLDRSDMPRKPRYAAAVGLWGSNVVFRHRQLALLLR